MTRSPNPDFYTDEEFFANYGSTLDLFVEQGILELTSTEDAFRVYKAGRYFLRYHKNLIDRSSMHLLALEHRRSGSGDYYISTVVHSKGDKTFNFQKDENIRGIRFIWTRKTNVDRAVQSLIEHCHMILEATLKEGLIQ